MEGEVTWLLRKVDVGITEAGLRLGINTYILNPPLIYRIGHGPINKQSLYSLGRGEGIWNIVHISDVAMIETTWRFISEAIASTSTSQGIFASPELKSLSPESFAENLGVSFLNAYMVEVVWGSNSRIKGIKSREFEWEPANGIADDFKIICLNAQFI
ncbi:hypothetical protein BDZ45DRAFT_753347 [Acephala macrosclerotiorum]|nr:hypothetical protein BDZ45DRAFT_753347 [Acephala macrosclerotiorum]